MSLSEGSNRLITCPFMITSPEVTLSTPAIIFKVELFPAPGLPNKTNNSFSFPLKVRSFTAVNSPYFLTTFRNSISATITPPFVHYPFTAPKVNPRTKYF